MRENLNLFHRGYIIDLKKHAPGISKVTGSAHGELIIPNKKIKVVLNSALSLSLSINSELLEWPISSIIILWKKVFSNRFSVNDLLNNSASLIKIIQCK